VSRHVFIVAAEKSGDELGSGLIEQIRQQKSNIEISGIGGASMAGLGVSSDIDISKLAVLGFTEGLQAYPIVLNRVRKTTEIIMTTRPDMVILIDSWGFMIRVAQALKKAGYKGKLIKYVAPQVFAMREGRAKILAKAVDHLMTIHSFDAHYFEQYGLPVTYVGNPMFDTDYKSGDAMGLRRDLQIPVQDPVLAILFGSRLSEIQRLAKPFAYAIGRLRVQFPNLAIVSPLSDTIATDVKAVAGADLRLQNVIFLPEHRKFDVFAASDVALACSGTVTTQLSCAGVPSVVAYRVSALTYFFGKMLFKQDYISLVNISAGRAVMPEYIQNDCTGEKLSDAVAQYLSNDQLARNTSRAQIAETKKMRGKGGQASARAAKTVLELLA